MNRVLLFVCMCRYLYILILRVKASIHFLLSPAHKTQTESGRRAAAAVGCCWCEHEEKYAAPRLFPLLLVIYKHLIPPVNAAAAAASLLRLVYVYSKQAFLGGTTWQSACYQAKQNKLAAG